MLLVGVTLGVNAEVDVEPNLNLVTIGGFRFGEPGGPKNSQSGGRESCFSS